MNEIINLCTEMAAYVCPKVTEDESVHIQHLLSDIMNKAREIANGNKEIHS